MSPKCSPAKIGPGVYQGCKPRTPADFAALRREGIRTIVNLETLYLHVEPERRLAEQNGIRFINIPLLASPLKPSERTVREILLTLHDPALHPIFIHCLVGYDRTTFIAALYRMYYLDWSPEAAWQKMLAERFHARWWLYGFKVYFWHHTQKPDWLEAGRCVPEARGPPTTAQK
jgi:protein-tyrosine phosphatase